MRRAGRVACAIRASTQAFVRQAFLTARLGPLPTALWNEWVR